MHCIHYRHYTHFFRLLQLFKTAFPYRNGLGRQIMDTEKVHFIKHCHVDVINYANPIHCCCDGPEGGHKTWVHEQGLKTNQGPSAAKTLMPHSLNKEASQLLCDAMQCRLEDGTPQRRTGLTPTAIPCVLIAFGNRELRTTLHPTMQGHVWVSSSIFWSGPK